MKKIGMKNKTGKVTAALILVLIEYLRQHKLDLQLQG